MCVTCACCPQFTNYMEVESREVPVSIEQPILTPENAEKFIDENTIGEAQNISVL